MIKKKGGAGFAVGLAIQEVIEAVALDRRAILPVSSVLHGCYGINDVAISVPSVVGRGGVQSTIEIELWPKEVQALRHSGTVLRQTIDTVLARVGSGPVASATKCGCTDKAKEASPAAKGDCGCQHAQPAAAAADSSSNGDSQFCQNVAPKNWPTSKHAATASSAASDSRLPAAAFCARQA